VSRLCLGGESVKGKKAAEELAQLSSFHIDALREEERRLG